MTATMALQCTGCRYIIPLPEEDAALLRLGGRVLVECPVCQTRFTGEPNRAWTFRGERGRELADR